MKHIVNDYLDVIVFPVDTTPHTPTIELKFLCGVMRDILKKFNIDSYVTCVSYMTFKHAFLVTTLNGKYMLRMIVKNINIILLARLLRGQPMCCAKAHALNTNLPITDLDISRDSLLVKYNITPCNECFETHTAYEYINKCESNMFRGVIHVGTSNSKQYSIVNALLYLLMNKELTYAKKAESLKVPLNKSFTDLLDTFSSLNDEVDTILKDISDIERNLELEFFINILQVNKKMLGDLIEDMVNNRESFDGYKLDNYHELRHNLSNGIFSIKFNLMYRGLYGTI